MEEKNKNLPKEKESQANEQPKKKESTEAIDPEVKKPIPKLAIIIGAIAAAVITVTILLIVILGGNGNNQGGNNDTGNSGIGNGGNNSSHSHLFSDWETTLPATCLTSGHKERACSCGQKESETIPATGHSYGEWTQTLAPTCTENGSERRDCSNCVFYETQVVYTNGHSYGEWSISLAPNCNDSGNKRRDCEACEHYEETVVDANGHTPAEAVVENNIDATCTTDGSYDSVIYCSVCNAKISSEAKVVTKFGHNYASVVTPPTKATDGYTTHTCSLCQDTYIDSHVPAIGSEGLAYEVNSDGTTCTITGIGNCTDSDVVIPSTIDGKTVTKIGTRAFSGLENITNIKIPDTVNAIAYRAFYGCTGLTEIAIPESVTEIGEQVFFKASNLNTVYYDSPYNTDNSFLKLEHIEKIVLGGEKMNYQAVQNLSNLKYLEISGNISNIPAGSKYLGVTDSGLTTIKNSLFVGSNNIISISIGDSVNTIGEYAFSGLSNLTTLIIGNGVKTIGSESFSYCRNLTNLTMGNNINKIGEKAFNTCSNLTEITLPASLTEVGKDAFCYCTNISKVYISDLAKWCNVSFVSSASNPLYYADELFLNNESITEIVIPDEVTNIGSYTFANCQNITSITIPSSILSIGEGAFENAKIDELHIDDLSKWCYITFGDARANPSRYSEKTYHNGTVVTEIVIPDDITSIKDCTYMCFKDLVSVVIPDSISFIGNYAFYGCTYLANLTIADSVTKIGNYAFYGCTNLTSLALPDSIITIGDYTFSNCTGLISLTLPDSVISIGSYAFSKCIVLINLTLPDGVTSIGSYAFYACTGLTSVTLSESVTDIGSKAFYNCHKLVEIINKSSISIYISSSYDHCITEYAMIVHTGESKIVNKDNFIFITIDNVNYLVAYSGNDTDIVLPENYNGENYVINNYAFAFCDRLTSVVIADSITAIEYRAFEDCTRITSVTIGSGVKKMEYCVFAGCKALEEIYFNAETMGDMNSNSNTFDDAGKDGDGLKVTIGKNVTRIPAYLFYKTGIISVVFEEGSVCESIGNSAFYDCRAIEEIHFNAIKMNSLGINNNVFYNAGINGDGIKVIIGKGVTRIPAYLFYPYSSSKSYTPKVTTIEFEEDSLCKTIGSYAFYQCTYLTSITISEGVTSIKEEAFYNCTAIEEIHFNATAMDDLTDKSRVFYNVGINGDGVKVVIGNNVTKIPDYLFYTYSYNSFDSYTPKITSVEFEEGSVCKSIGNSAFYDCKNLAIITIPNAITSIGESAFYNCTAIEEIYFNATAMDDLSRYGNLVFYDAGKYGNGIKIIIGNNVTKIPAFLFSPSYLDSPKITSVEFEEGSVCTNIGESAFDYCSSLTSINIPNNVTSIGRNAFHGCSSLTKVTFENPNEWKCVNTSYNLYNLSDASTAAEYLTKTYCGYDWKRS